MDPATSGAKSLGTSAASIADEIEVVYRRQGERMWRALYGYAGNRDIADDAVAEAFAQALRRGTALRQPERWIWRAAYKIAAGKLKERATSASPLPDLGRQDDHETVPHP